MAGPRYKALQAALEAGLEIDGAVVCEDCGAVVVIREAHTRFHSILSSHAWTLAVLKTSHIGAVVHDRYDAVERIDSKRFDSWSGDALAEVIAGHGQPPSGDT